jgi:hypothetical protein
MYVSPEFFDQPKKITAQIKIVTNKDTDQREQLKGFKEK